VLPIGGLKEKTMAALRGGVKTVLLPGKNRPDLEDIDPLVREKLEFVFVDHMDAVVSRLFAPVARLPEVPAEPPVKLPELPADIAAPPVRPRRGVRQ
jgi:ATP-dependent Lon protease